MCRIIQILAVALESHAKDSQIILSADCCRAHIAKQVWQTCTRHNICLHLIPAKMTWALQPCDTHVFASLKRRIQRGCVELMLQSPSGQLTKVQLFRAFSGALQEIVNNGNWQKAFHDVGMVGHQNDVSDTVLQQKCLDRTTAATSSDLPSLLDLQALWPDKSHIPVTEIFEVYIKQDESNRDVQDAPIRVQTRSMTAATLLEPEVAGSAASSCPQAPKQASQPSPTPPVEAVTPEPIHRPERPAQVATLLRLPSRSRLPPRPPAFPSLED